MSNILDMVGRSYETETNAVREQPPQRTGNDGEEFVRESQSPNSVSHPMSLPDEIRDDERDGGIQKDKKGDGKWADTEQVGGDLQSGGREHG